MAMSINNTGISGLAEVLSEKGLDGLGSAVAILINEAMLIERDRHINAIAYERTELRNGYMLIRKVPVMFLDLHKHRRQAL